MTINYFYHYEQTELNFLLGSVQYYNPVFNFKYRGAFLEMMFVLTGRLLDLYGVNGYLTRQIL